VISKVLGDAGINSLGLVNASFEALASIHAVSVPELMTKLSRSVSPTAQEGNSLNFQGPASE